MAQPRPQVTCTYDLGSSTKDVHTHSGREGVMSKVDKFGHGKAGI